MNFRNYPSRCARFKLYERQIFGNAIFEEAPIINLRFAIDANFTKSHDELFVIIPTVERFYVFDSTNG